MTFTIFHPINLRQDTIMQPSTVDTTEGPASESIIEKVVSDSAISEKPPKTKIDTLQQADINKTVSTVPSQITGKTARSTVYNPYKKTFNASDNFLMINALKSLGKKSSPAMYADSLVSGIETTVKPSRGSFTLQSRLHVTSDWVLPVILIILLLFIWIKAFYNRFFSFLGNSLISYQLSVKLYHEKNVLLKRVSLVLDVIYHIVLAVFLYESFTYFSISPAKLTSYNLFLFFLNILILYSLLRSVILNIFNTLFKTESIISEYVHNNFIVNKSIGIVLFPITIALYYMPENLSGILLVTGLVVLGTGFLFKIIRGYQIIIRKEVLLFYLILYLCTLEILPLFLGYKVFMSLL